MVLAQPRQQLHLATGRPQRLATASILTVLLSGPVQTSLRLVQVTGPAVRLGITPRAASFTLWMQSITGAVQAGVGSDLHVPQVLLPTCGLDYFGVTLNVRTMLNL